MTDSATWNCPSCHAAVTSRYCPACGERNLDRHELTLRGLSHQIFEALTSIDSKLVRSFVGLVARPGSLTLAYLQGSRKPYVGPVPLFLMANVLFFAVESLLGGQAFTTPLDSHLHLQPWGPLAETLIAHRLAALHISFDAYAPVFDQALALHARSLIIFMALSFAFFPWLVFRRRKRPIVVHAVFSLHLYAFLLSLLCIATALERWLGGPGAGPTPAVLDAVVSIALVLIVGAYLYLAAAPVYGARGLWRGVHAAVLAVAVAAIVLGYRFALFLLTLYTA